MIWVGRNSAYDGQVLKDAQRVAARFASGRYVVLGIPAGRYEAERPGEPRRTQLEQVNAELGAFFGDRFVEVASLLSCDDYNDNIHLTDAGYDKVARAVSARIKQLGY